MKIILIILCALTLQSCLPSAEISQRAIVEAVGIDKDEGGFIVSIEYYNPNSESEENTKTSFVEKRAKTIPLAISEINSMLGKKLYFGHNNIIILGKDAAQEDLIKILEYFDSDSETKSDICISVSDCAKEIIEFSCKNINVSPMSMLNIIVNSKKSDGKFEYMLFKIISSKRSESAFPLPYTRINEQQYFENCGIFEYFKNFE